MLHKPLRLAWLDVLLSPLKAIYSKFRTVTDDADFATKHSGIKIYLEKALNDKFDPGARTIYIDNVNNTRRNYIYSKREARAGAYVFGKTDINPLKPMYVLSRLEYFGTNDFIINISSSVIFNETLLRQFVDSFKPAGKRYTINIY